MAPEEVQYLVALRLTFVDGHLRGDGERVEVPGRLYVTWYTSTTAVGQLPIAGGLVHVPEQEAMHRSEIVDARLSDLGDEYAWREPAHSGASMIAMALPAGFTLTKSNPRPTEAKEIDGVLAVHWRIQPGEHPVTTLQLGLGPVQSTLREEIQRINRASLDQLASARPGRFSYDVALSFAGEDRVYVEKVATALVDSGVTVFYDRFEEASLWGKNLYEYLNEIYSRQARYTVIFISKYYAQKLWTSHERESAQERAFRENREYILPARFDDTPLPGLAQTTGYISLHGRTADEFARLIVQKLNASE